MATWADDIETALSNLGGEASLHEIYREVELVRGPERLTPSWQATVRGTLERHSPDSQVFGGRELFRSSGGIGRGRWALRRA